MTNYPNLDQVTALWEQHKDDVADNNIHGRIGILRRFPTVRFRGITADYMLDIGYVERGTQVYEYLTMRGPTPASRELIRLWEDGGEGELRIVAPRFKKGAWALKVIRTVVVRDEDEEINGNK